MVKEVAVDFAMVEVSCALGVIVDLPGTRVGTYYSSDTEERRV